MDSASGALLPQLAKHSRMLPTEARCVLKAAGPAHAGMLLKGPIGISLAAGRFGHLLRGPSDTLEKARPRLFQPFERMDLVISRWQQPVAAAWAQH